MQEVDEKHRITYVKKQMERRGFVSRVIRFEDMHTHNRAVVLRLIHDRGPLSRADLVRLTGFTAPSISRIAEHLLHNRLLVEEPGVMDAGPGRPPTLLSFDAQGWSTIAANVFPDRIHAGLVDLTGHVYVEEWVRTGQTTPQEAFGVLGRLVQRLWREAARPERVTGVSVTLPGLIDARRRSIRFSPPTGWRDVSIADLLRPHTRLPVVTENWVSARALAERLFGAARGVDDFVYVHASQGIGATITSGGRLHRGETFTSTEFGHVPLATSGPRCRCGRRGCLEALAAVDALPRYYRVPGVDAAQILSRSRGGEPAAQAAVERAVGYLALGMAGLVHLLNPSRILVDGWPLEAGAFALAHLRAALAKRVLQVMGDAVILVPSRLGERGPLIGGVALALEALLDLTGTLSRRGAEEAETCP